MAVVNADNLPQEDAPTADARPMMVNDLAGATELVLGPVLEDKYLQLSGGTLTSALTLGAANPKLRLYETDGVADARGFEIYSNGGNTTFRAATDLWGGVRAFIVCSHANQNMTLSGNIINLNADTRVDMNGSASVQVPAPADGDTATAAQTTAMDSATHRVGVNGADIGDTGWHTIASWTGGVQDGSDQWGVIDLTHYSLGGDGKLQVRRTGAMVSVRLPNAGGDSITAVTGGAIDIFTSGNWPVGFQIETPFAYAVLHHSGYVGGELAAIGRGSSSNNMKINTAAGVELARATATFLGTSSWPTVMPGVPA